MKRYPLQTLLKLREHRTEAARQVVMDRQKDVRARQEDCRAVEGEIVNLQNDRQQHRLNLMAAPPDGVPWPMALAQREAHIDFLAEQVVAARGRLAKAQEALKAAEKALQEARDAFFRAKGREDALHKRKSVWKTELKAEEARQEESDAEELFNAALSRRKN